MLPYYIIRHRTRGFFLSFDEDLWRPTFFKGEERSCTPYRFPSYSAALCMRTRWAFGLQRHSGILERDASVEAFDLLVSKARNTT